MSKVFIYILFVKTGYEYRVAKELLQLFRDNNLRPFVPTYKTQFIKAGKVSIETQVLFPGYVFIQSEIPESSFYMIIQQYITRIDKAIKLLRYSRNTEDYYSIALINDDYLMLSKLYNDEYCVEMSQGLISGDKIIITEGPLKEFEGYIKRVNRHKREAVIEIRMMGQLSEVTVGLEILNKNPK